MAGTAVTNNGLITKSKISKAREANLKKKSKETLYETLDKFYVSGYRRILVVRPTGFGKSYMLAGLTSPDKIEQYIEDRTEEGKVILSKYKDIRFKNCLYVYPTNVIRDSVINTYRARKPGEKGGDERSGMLQNTSFISYSKLTRVFNSLSKIVENNTPSSDEEQKELDEAAELEDVENADDNGNGPFIAMKEVYPGIKISVSNTPDVKVTKLERIKPLDAKHPEKDINSFVGWISQYDLIMLDECHRVGATGFEKIWKEIKGVVTDTNNKILLVGATATPDRMDKKDIKEVFGNKNTISKLTLDDCISQGLMNKFDYVYAISDFNKFIDDSKKAIELERKKNGNEPLRQYEIDDLNDYKNSLKTIPDILKERISLANTGGIEYMRFIVFFSDKEQILKIGNKVTEWFRRAFLDDEYDIPNPNIIVTQSKGDDEKFSQVGNLTDVDMLDKLTMVNKRIDLIYCIDMLNMGYHVEDITGIMILRATRSAITYNQQIGRCFSVRSASKPIIIDLVDKDTPTNLLNVDTDGLDAGQQNDLVNILKPSSLDVYNYAEDFLKFINDLKTQRFTEVTKGVVRFWLRDRHAPADVIKDIIGTTDANALAIVKEVILEDKKNDTK